MGNSEKKMSESKVNELMDLINDEDIMTSKKKSDKLDKLLEELSQKKPALKIKAKSRFTCMICSKKFLKGDEKVELDYCECLQSVHNVCLKKKMDQCSFLKCYSCETSMKYNMLKRMQNNSVIESPNEDLKKNKNASMVETADEERKSKNFERNSFDKAKMCALCKQNKGVFTLICSHFLCRTCLKNYISQVADNQKLYDQMRCPNLMCNSQIFKKEFNEVLMKDEEIGHIVKEIQQKKKHSEGGVTGILIGDEQGTR